MIQHQKDLQKRESLLKLKILSKTVKKTKKMQIFRDQTKLSLQSNAMQTYQSYKQMPNLSYYKRHFRNGECQASSLFFFLLFKHSFNTIQTCNETHSKAQTKIGL